MFTHDVEAMAYAVPTQRRHVLPKLIVIGLGAVGVVVPNMLEADKDVLQSASDSRDNRQMLTVQHFIIASTAVVLAITYLVDGNVGKMHEVRFEV
jgi:hypothetical protein